MTAQEIDQLLQSLLEEDRMTEPDPLHEIAILIWLTADWLRLVGESNGEVSDTREMREQFLVE